MRAEKCLKNHFAKQPRSRLRPRRAGDGKQHPTIAGAGLAGDRYSTGEGSSNRKRQGRRQVTLIRENAPSRSETRGQ
jgi:hypothetical protein